MGTSSFSNFWHHKVGRLLRKIYLTTISGPTYHKSSKAYKRENICNKTQLTLCQTSAQADKNIEKKRFSKFFVTRNNIAAFWVTLEDIVNEWAMFSDELRIIQKLSQYNY